MKSGVRDELAVGCSREASVCTTSLPLGTDVGGGANGAGGASGPRWQFEFDPEPGTTGNVCDATFP